MRTIRRLVPALVLTAVLAAGAAAEEEAKPEKKLTFSGEVGLKDYMLRGAYFGSPDQPAADGEYGWLESIARVGLSWSISDHVAIDVGAAGLFTLS